MEARTIQRSQSQEGIQHVSAFRDDTDNKELTGYTGRLAVPSLDEMPGSRGISW